MTSEFIRLTPPRLLVCPGDPHFPRQDSRSLRCMSAAVEGTMQMLGVKRQDAELCFTGDFFDSAGFSPHPSMKRAAGHGGTIADERREAAPWLNTWRAMFGTIRLVAGNHEAWQESSLALDGSPWWEAYGDLLDGCQLHPEGTKLRYGQLVVAHGHDLRGSLSKHSAAAVLQEYPGQNTLYGHTHRLQGCTTPTLKHGEPVAHGAWTVGMMVARAEERKDRRMRSITDRHQQGFAMVYFSPGAGFKVELCEVFSRGNRRWTIVAGQGYSV